MIHVFIADDHRIVRKGLRALIDDEPDMRVVGEAGDGWDVLRALQRDECTVDVLILDLSMPVLGGFEVLRRAHELRPALQVLVLSMYPREHWETQLQAAGAAGYVSKSDSDTKLIDAIRSIALGNGHFSSDLSDEPSADTSPPHHALTGRELQVFLLVIEGRSVMDIAAALSVGQSTVSTHMARIRAKLKVESVAAMVTYAHREGLIA